MHAHFAYPTNAEGSLKIYEPPGQTISKTFFTSQNHTNINGNKSRHYLRQQSIIDKLANKDENSQEGSARGKGASNHQVEPRPTSIEFLVDLNEPKINLKQQNIKIEDIFANRPALSSKEFTSSILKSLNGPLFQQKAAIRQENLEDRSKNSNSHIVLPSFPSKQYLTDSPQRPNLNRPFLRKKTSSVRNSEAVEPTPSPLAHPTRKDQQSTFQFTKLENAIKHLKQYNGELMNVFKCLQEMEEDQGSNEWRKLGHKEMDLLKLMVEKAIIGKEEYH